MVEDAALAEEDVPDVVEYEEVPTGGQQVVQAKVHGEAEHYPLENEDDEDDENDDKEDEEEDEEDPEWEAEVTRQQEIGLIKIKVDLCFTSSG